MSRKLILTPFVFGGISGVLIPAGLVITPVGRTIGQLCGEYCKQVHGVPGLVGVCLATSLFIYVLFVGVYAFLGGMSLHRDWQTIRILLIHLASFLTGSFVGFLVAASVFVRFTLFSS